MLHAVLQILPLLFIFGLGYGLKRAKMLTSADGTSLLKLMFFIGAPALIFVSIMRVEITSSMIWLCFLAPVIGCVTVGITLLLRRSLLKKVPVKTFGVMLAGTAAMNTGFLIPFVERIYGAEGLARLAVIDAFNAFVVFGLVYAIVVKLANDTPDKSFIFKKLLIAPPLWALCVATIFRLLSFTPPDLVMDTFGVIAKLVSPVVLIALGLKFVPRIRNPKLLLVPFALRFVLGATIGLAFVKLVGLHGLTAEIALFTSIAPIGFNSITFAELEHMDVEFAATQVSAALIAALVMTPFIVQFLPRLV